MPAARAPRRRAAARARPRCTPAEPHPRPAPRADNAAPRAAAARDSARRSPRTPARARHAREPPAARRTGYAAVRTTAKESACPCDTRVSPGVTHELAQRFEPGTASLSAARADHLEVRTLFATFLAVLVISGAVLYASEAQRSVAEVNFNEAQTAKEMAIGVLE